MQSTPYHPGKSDSTILDRHHSNLNLPNFLTILRILLIPGYIALFSIHSTQYAFGAAIVFGIAALTDFFDGYLARRHSQITTLGRFLDPVADKLLVAAGLILLVQHQRIASWLAIAILAREISVTGLRAIAASEGMIICSDNIGKAKTFLQIMGILLLTLPIPTIFFAFNLHNFGNALLYFSLALGVLSGLRYLSAVVQKIDAGDRYVKDPPHS